MSEIELCFGIGLTVIGVLIMQSNTNFTFGHFGMALIVYCIARTIIEDYKQRKKRRKSDGWMLDE